MAELRTLTYVVKMDTGDGKIKARDFRVTLKTMEQDAKKASKNVDDLAKSIGQRYATNVQTAVDQTRTVKAEIQAAAREANRAEKNYERLAAEYRHLTARTGKSAETQQKMNALQRLGSSATLTQKKEIIKLVRAQQAQVKATINTQRSMRGLRGQAQNLGYQLQDVAVQAQMGTDALVILGQQGSQLAAGFGATGALIGAVIAVSAAISGTLIKSLTGASDNIDELTKKMAEWSKTVGLTKQESEFLIATEQKEIATTSKAILSRAEKIKVLNDERIKYQALLKQSADTFVLESKVGSNLVGQVVTRKELTKRIAENKVKSTELMATTKAELRLNEERRKKIIQYAKSVGQGTDEQEKWIESNKDLVKSISEQAHVTGLSRVEVLELNKATDLNKLKTQNATDEQVRATEKAYDQIIANAELAESEVELRKELAQKSKVMSAAAKYSDEGKLALLESQYKKERELLVGNQEALKGLEEHYNNERIKISGTFWEKYAASATDKLKDMDDLVINSLDRFTSGFGNAIADAAFESNSLSEAMANIFKDVGKNMVAFFAEWAAHKIMLWTLDQNIGASTQTAAATTMTANAEAASIQAGLNAFSSTAAIPIVGPALAPAAAASAVAATQPMAATVSGLAFAGVFDKGGMIPSGSAGIVSEYGDELVGGTMVYNGSPNSLKVTGREETARMTSNSNVNNITINSNGSASPEAISRALVRALKRGSKTLDNEVYGSMNRGRRNKGKRFA